MSVSEQQAQWFGETFASLVANIEQAVLGKRDAVELAVTCLLSEGHLLLEDVPGTGKTSLAKALANTVEGSQHRIQFTPDLLPSDVTGATVYNQQTGSFEFHRGPVFATIVLVDEINRASPKTQSALLEVMEEGKVTVDGERHDVGTPFMVIATQNPVEQAGVYQLPEAQLDRFLLRTSLGYPDLDTTITLLESSGERDRTIRVDPLVASSLVVEMAGMAAQVHVDRTVLGYITQIAERTRTSPNIALGVSTRGCLALTRAAKTWAIAHGAAFVTPDDVKHLVPFVFGHRIKVTSDAEFNGLTGADLLTEIMADVPPPSGR